MPDRNVCPETKAYCQCHLEAGHSGPHGCDPDICGGAWCATCGDPLRFPQDLAPAPPPCEHVMVSDISPMLRLEATSA
jgi:hypothetical protein